jgi:D-alanyl-D-alanine carboxypeptidase
MKPDFISLKKRWFVPLALTILLPLLTASQGFSPQTQARLQHIIDSFQNNPANPYIGGMAAAIKVDGLAFWQGAAGYAARNVDAANNLLPGGTPFQTTTLSRMYSVTKTFTASLVLELVKNGVFSLDDPVTKFIPFLSAINPELNGAVTIRQLLVHESGFSDYATEQMLQIAVAFQPTHQWTVFEMLSFVHQVNAPGAVRKYCNTNYPVLGAIVEIATGKPVEQHFRERFFTPLALNSMYFDAREPQPAGTVLASPHDNISPFNPIFQFTGQPTFPDAITNISAFPFTAISTLEFTSGGLITNIADLAEWGNALFGGRATSHATLEEMINSISPTPDEDGDYLGYGIFRTTRISPTDVFIGHDGNAPGYRSVMFYQPDRKMTIAILTNYRGARLYDVAKALFEALPAFTCGNKNRKEDKIVICYNGNNLCVDRKAAGGFIEKGAYLGGCAAAVTRSAIETNTKANNEISVNEKFIEVFPNPSSAHTWISFKTTQPGKVKLELYDINGRLVKVIYESNLDKNTTMRLRLETGTIRPGMYIIKMNSGQDIFQQKLLVKN